MTDNNSNQPFQLPANPPKDIILSKKNYQEILIKNHFSFIIVWGPLFILMGIPFIYFTGIDFLNPEGTGHTGSDILELSFGIFLVVVGTWALYREIREQFTTISLIVDNDMLKVKFNNASQPIEIQRGLNIVLLVDGIEMVTNGPPTHRIVPKLKYRGEIIVSFGSISKKQYLWLKELFKSYFKLKIEYENEVLKKMQL